MMGQQWSPRVRALFAAAVGLLALVSSTGSAYADPMSTPDSTPRLLDSGQFGALMIAAALVVTLLAMIAVTLMRKR